MIVHDRILRGLRARLATLSLATTGSTTLEATATGYARASGSFLDDGFALGMPVTPTGFTQTDTGVITALSDLTMAIDGGRDVEASGGSRTIAALLPEVAYQNVRFDRPVSPKATHLEEEYLPGGAAKPVLGAFGTVEQLPLYVLRVLAPAERDLAAVLRVVDAVLAHFPPTRPITVTGATCTVRSDTAPTPSPVQVTEDGWAACTVTIPLRVHTPNLR